MWWFILLAVSYCVAVGVVFKSDNKTTQVAVMVGWGLIALLVGHLAWRMFG